MGDIYDAVVVGAGPAGSAAARTLAAGGLRTALLDRRAFPRPKLCGGLLTRKTVRVLDRVFGLAPADLDPLTEVSVDRYGLFDRGRLVAEGASPHPFRLVDRTRFDQVLLDRAVAAGAEPFLGQAASACNPEAGEVRTADGRTFRGRFVIGADGANSVLRRSLGVDRETWLRDLAASIEVHLPPDALPGPVAFPELHAGCLEAGYGWVFPNRDRVVVGIGGLLRANADFHRLFRDFLALRGVRDPQSVELRGHPLPYGNWLRTPCRGRLLLAGDAAGMVEPLLGEGIFYALASGWYAAEAVQAALRSGTDPAGHYLPRLRRHLFPEFQGSNLMRWSMFAAYNLLGTSFLKLFMGAGSTRLAELVHGDRSFRFLRTKVWDF